MLTPNQKKVKQMLFKLGIIEAIQQDAQGKHHRLGTGPLAVVLAKELEPEVTQGRISIEADTPVLV